MDDTANDKPTTLNELELLKQRATVLGVEFSNNIGIDTLRKRIEDKLNSSENTDDGDDEGDEGEGEGQGETGSGETSQETEQLNPLAGETAETKPKSKKMSLRQKLRAEQLKLVRVRITNMDPKKKDLPGEILTVANEYLGTVRKFVPFGEATEDGYHVPYCLYKMLTKRRFLNVRTRKGKNGTPVVEQSWAKEFAIEVLPDLTRAELANLATAQAAAGSFNAD